MGQLLGGQWFTPPVHQPAADSACRGHGHLLAEYRANRELETVGAARYSQPGTLCDEWAVAVDRRRTGRYRSPLPAEPLLGWFAERSLTGVETVEGDEYKRTVRLPRSAGWVSLRIGADVVSVRLRVSDLRDIPAAVQRCRELRLPAAKAVSDSDSA